MRTKSSHFAVVLDACVLYPSPLRSLLLFIATKQVFRAHWSETIHQEWMRNLQKNRPDLDPKKLERTRDLMDRHSESALVVGFEYLIDRLQLPDPDDRHVLAAAIHAKAAAIVTFNLQDFPDQQLSGYAIQALHPDDFLCDLMDLYPAEILSAVREARSAMQRPHYEANEYLELLQRQGLSQFTHLLKPWITLI
jgi:predicted nucleic acid-binding protein